MADLAITAASVVKGANATVLNGKAGETITAGKVVFKDTSDGNKYKEAVNTSQANAKASGVALNGASDNQPIALIQQGDLNPGATVTVGEIYVLSNTAGGIGPEADLASTEYVTLLGVGTTASNIAIKLQVSGKQVP